MSAATLLVSSYYGKQAVSRESLDHAKMEKFYSRMLSLICYSGQSEDVLRLIAKEELTENGNWMHCLCNDRWSYCTVHEKRGSKAMEEIGLIPSLDNCTLVHDFWGSYLKYNNVKHSFCNAHLERELIYAHETTGQKWADELCKLLSEMCGKRNALAKEGFTGYPPELLQSYFVRYDALVELGLAANPLKESVKGKRGRKAKGKTRCLLERLRDYRNDILRFAADWTVPFTNNEAERCIRFSKVKEKVSGCFRTKQGADNFMSIMSYIGSAKKHGMSAYTALLEAVNGRSLQTVQA